QIIGFIGFQARVAAIFQAFCRLPVRELPGQEMQRFARAARFQNPQTIWRPAASLVEYPQIIGFIGFQARVAAIFQAFCRLPVRELPGQEM
ncbi:hypothetical protein V5H41_28050, partial [Salmonella enterica]